VREGVEGEGATLPPAGQPAQLALTVEEGERSSNRGQAREQPARTGRRRA
jgi:hypothetical protein